jgi:hypothetical protein
MGAYLTHPVGHPMSDADHQPLGIQVGQEGDLQGGEGDIPGAGRKDSHADDDGLGGC